MRALVSLDVTYAQGYGLARPGPPWPAPLAEATAAGAAEIRSGLRVAIAPRGVAGAFASGMAELSDELADTRPRSPTSAPRCAAPPASCAPTTSR